MGPAPWGMWDRGVVPCAATERPKCANSRTRSSSSRSYSFRRKRTCRIFHPHRSRRNGARRSARSKCAASRSASACGGGRRPRAWSELAIVDALLISLARLMHGYSDVGWKSAGKQDVVEAATFPLHFRSLRERRRRRRRQRGRRRRKQRGQRRKGQRRDGRWQRRPRTRSRSRRQQL